MKVRSIMIFYLKKPSNIQFVYRILIIALLNTFILGAASCTKQHSSSSIDEKIIKQLEVAVNEGNTETYIQKYTKKIEQNPKDALAYYYRGLLYTYSDRLTKGLEDYNNAIRLESDNFPVFYYQRALLFEKTGNFDKALKDIDKSLELSKHNNSEILFQAGRLNYAFGDEHKAVSYLQEFVENSDEATYKKQFVFLQDILKRLREGFPLSLETALFKHRIPYKLEHLYSRNRNDSKTIIKVINKYIAENPDDKVYGMFLIGDYYYSVESYDKALEYFQKAENIDNSFIPAIYKSGDIFVKQGKYEKAIQKANQAEKIRSNCLTLSLIAESYYAQGKTQKATSIFQELVDSYPEYSNTYTNLGGCYANSDSYEKAIPLFEKAKKINILADNNYLALGYCYNNLHDYKSLIATYNDYLKVIPKNDKETIRQIQEWIRNAEKLQKRKKR